MGVVTMIDEVKIGDLFSAGPRTTGFEEWNRFAAVNDEFVQIHMDDDAGRKAGYSGAIAMGRLQWSYVHNLLRKLLGGRGRIVVVDLKFVAPILKEEAFDVKARVTALRNDPDGKYIDLDVWIENDGGKILAPGSATIEPHAGPCCAISGATVPLDA